MLSEADASSGYVKATGARSATTAMVNAKAMAKSTAIFFMIVSPFSSRTYVLRELARNSVRAITFWTKVPLWPSAATVQDGGGTSLAQALLRDFAIRDREVPKRAFFAVANVTRKVPVPVEFSR